MAQLKDGRKGHWWKTENVILDRYAKQLKPAGFLVYSALLRHARAGSCFPSLRYLSDKLGLSKSTILRALKQTVKLGLVKVEREGRENVYTILNAPEQGPELAAAEPRRPGPKRCQTGTAQEAPNGTGLTPESVPVCHLSSPRTVVMEQDTATTGAAAAAGSLSEEQQALAQELLTVAPTLALEHAEHKVAANPVEKVRAAIAAVRERIAGGRKLTNPAGYLLEAIAKGWTPSTPPTPPPDVNRDQRLIEQLRHRAELAAERKRLAMKAVPS